MGNTDFFCFSGKGKLSNIFIMWYMKKGKSDTPLTCALKPFILELSDSAAALVDLLLK